MKVKLFSRADAGTVKNTIAIYREESKPFKKTIQAFSVLIPFSHFLYVVLLPLLISFVVQSLIENPDDMITPSILVGGIILSGALSLLVQHYAFIAFFNHEERMTTNLAERALAGLLRHSHLFFGNQKVGSLAGDVNTFSRSYLSIMDTLFLQASPIIVSFVTSLIIIAIIAPLLLIPLILLTGFIVVESIISLQRRAVYRNQRKEMQSKLFGSIADVLGNQTLVRMFSRQNNEVKAIVNERRAIERVASDEINLLQRSAEVRQGGLYIFQALTMVVMILLVSRDMVSIAALVFSVTYLGRVTGAMYNINSIIRTCEQAFLDASKVTDILTNEVEVVDVRGAKPLVVKHASIEFDDVTFSYGNASDSGVFEHLSMRLPPNQSIGLVGRSGGGKSTLTQLLLRYMDVGEGRILIDGQDIASVTQDSLRSQISYVPQDPYLFHRSLRDNITYGKESASDEEIDSAVRKAYAAEFIDELPDGLDTIVGERGVKLSGGQRQRVAIARAILKDAPILILDEATSALDSESEKYIQQALTKLMKNRTSIVIAHRLSTIAKLDRIVVLEQGRIVEDGTHAELLNANSVYANLWSHQSGGFLED
jgi:ATP-binding cassette subfamily B protein